MHDIIGSTNRNYNELITRLQAMLDTVALHAPADPVTVEVTGQRVRVAMIASAPGEGYHIHVDNLDTSKAGYHYAPTFDRDTIAYVIWRGIVSVLM